MDHSLASTINFPHNSLLSTNIWECYSCIIPPPLPSKIHISILTFLSNTCIGIVTMLLHALFSNKFYNLLPCYPIPIGSYGPKTLVAYFPKFSKILFNIFIGQTFKLQMLATNFIMPNISNPYPTLSPPL
jgi:hypothetical protein